MTAASLVQVILFDVMTKQECAIIKKVGQEGKAISNCVILGYQGCNPSNTKKLTVHDL